MITWEPVELLEPVDFSKIERAMGQAMHADAKEFYSSFLAGHLERHHSGFTVGLNTVWNLSQLEEILDFIEGHVEEQRLEGRAFTIPIASSDSDPIFSVVNSTGEIVLQDFDRPDVVVAPNLCVFLDGLITWKAAAAGLA